MDQELFFKLFEVISLRSHLFTIFQVKLLNNILIVGTTLSFIQLQFQDYT